MTTQVPETIGGTIPHKTITDAMREDGFLPPLLPKRKRSYDKLISEPVLVDEYKLSERTTLTFRDRSYSSLHVFVGGQEVGADLDLDARTRAVLPLLIDELEKALPILRAMVQKLKDTSETAESDKPQDTARSPVA